MPSRDELRWIEFNRLATRLEPEFRRTFLNDLEQFRANAPAAEELASAISRGDVNRVLAMLGLGEERTAVGLANAIQAALPQISKELIRLSQTPATDAFQFDQVNPRVLQFLEETEFRLIRQVDENTRKGIRQVVRMGVQRGANPIDTARDVRQLVGLTERQAAAVQNYRRLLQEASAGEPGAASAARARRLRDKRFSVGQGMAQEKIDRMVERYRERYIKHRAETIARTESINALNQANMETWRQMEEQGMVNRDQVRRFWLVARDERTCPRCRPIPALNPNGVGMEQAFDTPQDGLIMAPIVHPSCRCAVFIRTVEGEIESPGLDFSREGRRALRDGDDVTQVQIDGQTKRFHLPEGREDQFEIVETDMDKFDDAWKQDTEAYISPEGSNEIGDRRERFKEFLGGSDKVEMSQVGGMKLRLRRDPQTGEAVPSEQGGFQSVQAPQIEDGRHRLAVLRDKGVRKVPIAVKPEIAEDFRAEFGTD